MVMLEIMISRLQLIFYFCIFLPFYANGCAYFKLNNLDKLAVVFRLIYVNFIDNIP